MVSFNNPSRRRTISRYNSKFIQLSAVLLLFTLSSGLAQASTFDFSSESSNSLFSIIALPKNPRPDLAGTDGVAEWQQWCFKITALRDTGTEPGEMTHIGAALSVDQHMNDPNIRSTILSSMTVASDKVYWHLLKTSGPLNALGWHVLWENNSDDLVDNGDSAVFCYATPAIPGNTMEIGGKVAGLRIFQFLSPPSTIPTLQQSMLLILGLVLLAFGAQRLRKSKQIA